MLGDESGVIKIFILLVGYGSGSVYILYLVY